MNAPILRYPVSLPDGTELMPAGALLTEATLEEAIHRREKIAYPESRLFDHGSIRRDLLRFCNVAPYDRIFSDEKRVAGLLDLMGQIELIAPLLGFLDRFKREDPYTYRHILVVFALSLLLAQDLIADPPLPPHQAVAATTHDFGKLCVPTAILKKKTPLTRRERDHLRHHALGGYVLLSIFFNDPDHPAAITARDHHERRDGSGYPSGLPLSDPFVEIVAVSDVFDALIASRPYRPTSYDLRTALEEITQMAQRGRFRWDVVQALVSFNRSGRPRFDSCTVSDERRGIPPQDNLYDCIQIEDDPA
ncbi:MAG: hypothetical protein PVH30_00090 [Desulfobacterales bacterium]|jgi:HD-GYP domain-containing protein (c-di-GMP phosphodiesterase class II)